MFGKLPGEAESTVGEDGRLTAGAHSFAKRFVADVELLFEGADAGGWDGRLDLLFRDADQRDVFLRLDPD
eukprot:1238802-Lingulodinium_polyedra.AAC.1